MNHHKVEWYIWNNAQSLLATCINYIVICKLLITVLCWRFNWIYQHIYGCIFISFPLIIELWWQAAVGSNWYRLHWGENKEEFAWRAAWVNINQMFILFYLKHLSNTTCINKYSRKKTLEIRFHSRVWW